MCLTVFWKMLYFGWFPEYVWSFLVCISFHFNFFFLSEFWTLEIEDLHLALSKTPLCQYCYSLRPWHPRHPLPTLRCSRTSHLAGLAVDAVIASLPQQPFALAPRVPRVLLGYSRSPQLFGILLQVSISEKLSDHPFLERFPATLHAGTLLHLS